MSKDYLGTEQMEMVKRHLDITWDDKETDKKINDMMQDAEIELNHMLGAEIDYSAPGRERRLYLSYMLYVWNNCLDDFEKAYMREINRIRRYYAVKGAVASET